ncbi:MAG: hypothetical protein R3290_09070 [Acidimicrobiia bacterium]|nr:hypothetical protein [Acidimicrobiia bacterium]
MHRLMAAGAAVLILVTACGDDATSTTTTTEPSTTTTTQPERNLVTFETADGERYVVELSDADAQRAREALAADGHAGIPNGLIQPGDGGINTGHDWHVIDVELADMTMELCDGTVSYIDDLGYDAFVAEHGDRFCPWGAKVVAVG